MTRKLMLALGLALVCGLLAAGCGGGSKSSKTQTAPPLPPPTAPPPPPAASATSVETATSSGGSVAQAVALCKSSVEQAQVDAASKADLKALCDKAASGDLAAVRKAAREICRKVVERNVPAGSQRDQALQACDQAVQGSSP
jgi:hypothetical protein